MSKTIMYVTLSIIAFTYLMCLFAFLYGPFNATLKRDRERAQLNQCISTVIQEDTKVQDSYATWVFEFCKLKVSQGQ